MPTKTRLTAVADPAPTPSDRSAGPISRAAESGSRLDLLVAMRDHIAARVDAGVAARDLAALVRRMVELTQEIETVRAAQRDSVRRTARARDVPFDPSGI